MKTLSEKLDDMTKRTYQGFVKPEIKPEDYVFGASSIPNNVLAPDGQWVKWLPKGEKQRGVNMVEDPCDCTVANTHQCLEILWNCFKLEPLNFDASERFTASKAGIRPPGASPIVASDFIRHKGVVAEQTLPLTDDIRTLDQFYGGITEEMVAEAAKFATKNEWMYEWVFLPGVHTQEDITNRLKNALQYSPIGVAVNAWNERNGFYISLGEPNHWTCLVGYQQDKYWLVYDSYEPYLKKLAWDYPFAYAMRYYLRRRSPQEQLKAITESVDTNPFASFVKLIKDFFYAIFKDNQNIYEYKKKENMPVEPPVDVVKDILEQKDKLIPFCEAIKKFEGWYPGSRSYRNNNPGNTRYSSAGYRDIYGHVKKDSSNFAIFETYDKGWLYLQNFIKAIVKGQSRQYPKGGDMTIMEFFATYSPSFENDTAAYAKKVAKDIGETTETKLKDFINCG